VNADERLEFVAMWNAELDQIELLDIAAWLRAYSQIHIRNNPGPAMELVARIDDKIRTAADAIEQLTKQRDAERREYCELCAPEWGLPSPQWLAKDKGWDCYEKETT
jgi:hypothetical protein